MNKNINEARLLDIIGQVSSNEVYRIKEGLKAYEDRFSRVLGYRVLDKLLEMHSIRSTTLSFYLASARESAEESVQEKAYNLAIYNMDEFIKDKVKYFELCSKS